jgi:hypothetical protein
MFAADSSTEINFAIKIHNTTRYCSLFVCSIISNNIPNTTSSIFEISKCPKHTICALPQTAENPRQTSTLPFLPFFKMGNMSGHDQHGHGGNQSLPLPSGMFECKTVPNSSTVSTYIHRIRYRTRYAGTVKTLCFLMRWFPCVE